MPSDQPLTWPPHRVRLAPGWLPSTSGLAIDFLLRAGEIAIVVGPNGSGKSSLLRKVADCLVSSTLTQLIVETDARHVPASTAEDVLVDLAPGNTDIDTLRASLDRVGVVHHRLFGFLSLGEQQRLLLAALSLSDAQVVLLDDPSAHLDSAGLDLLEDAVVTTVAEMRSVIIATTDPELVLRFPRAVIYTLSGGELFERRPRLGS